MFSQISKNKRPKMNNEQIFQREKQNQQNK